MKKVVMFYTMLVSTTGMAQNVGIGTSTPTRAKLEVVGAVDATSAIFGGESSGISLQRNWPGVGFNTYWNGGDKNLASGFAAKHFFDPTSGYMYLDMLPYGNANDISAGSYRAFTISPLGKIGIGGAVPNAELQLPNTITNRKIVLWESANNNNQYYGLGIESGTLRYNVGDVGNVHRFYAGTGPNTSKLLMSIWGDRTVTIGDETGGGRLGINLSSPAYTLTVRQAGGTGIYLQEAGSGTSWEFRAGYTAQTDYAVMYLRHNDADIGFFRPNGDYVSYSDRRLKTNIEPLPPTLTKLMQLHPKIYEMKVNNSPHEKSIGFIAQEVKTLFPELVFASSSNNSKEADKMNGLSYSGFAVIAIKAIQEQQEQLNSMKKEIDLLKEQNRKLMELLDKQ